ncbi:DNA repair protein XRCC4-like isoform X2 [Syngnathoides biaculeatus]|uniref:DNA repair protein XRCC4-like isoform X2 n=1 Tax=Syngnathoides biaculeatus TaxID=300417 RepID=UPI002ADDFFAF|nr:DNA repair protein XRCC4-like isoform X2 [Syngnathoides biaculeatus]
MSSAVRQITVATDPGTPYFLRVDFAVSLSAGFTLALSDGISAWNGEVSVDEVMREAKVIKAPMEEYVEDLHQALMGGGQGRGGERRASEGDIYSFDLSLDRLQLSYHKMCDGVSVHLGSLKLQPAAHPLALTREMIGQALKSNTNLEKENSLLLDENRKLKEDHVQIIQELERQVQDKETTTRDLYTHFVMVLNEKKAKIRSLQDALSQLQPTTRLQRTQRDDHISLGEDVSLDSKTETTESSHLSLEPTLLTAGRSTEIQKKSTRGA